MHVFLWIFQNFYHKQYSVVVYRHSVKYSYGIPNEYLSGSMAISLLTYVAIFSDSLIFGKATSSQFLRVTFFKVSQELLFRSKTSTLKPNLGNRKFFSAVTFQNSYPEKTSTEDLLFQSRFFCTTSTFSKKARFWKSLLFQKSKIPIYLLFPGSYLLLPFSLITTFYSSYIFREELLFYNIHFQKSHYFTGILLFHSYTSY